ncbi:MAG: FAD-dependent thymidylate synthase [Dehalococcoidia bacterium]
MRRVEPQVFLVAESKVNREELERYLQHIGAAGWDTDAPTDVEEVVEVMARNCYKSFGPGLNPNVTRVRPDNKSHLANLIRVRHGSTMEHSWVSFLITDVSRVFTHELVRHRVGTAISQESLRFVRLEDMGLWVPPCYANNPKANEIFENVWEFLEKKYEELIEVAGEMEGEPFNQLPFHIKKKYTSAARRVAPIGVATNVGWSCNMRALRHIIEDRTDPGAEEEIRLVFGKFAEIAIERWPNLFGDYEVEMVDGLPCYKTANRKV